jgi:hypothetical protein
MRIPHNQPMRIPFILVGEDAVAGVEGATVTTTVSINGLPFQPTINQPQETADGWYYVDLEPEETATQGPLVFVASAPEAAFQWRDIHQVDTPDATMDAEHIRQVVQEELAQWDVVITAPIKLIRAGSTN